MTLCLLLFVGLGVGEQWEVGGGRGSSERKREATTE